MRIERSRHAMSESDQIASQFIRKIPPILEGLRHFGLAPQGLDNYARKSQGGLERAPPCKSFVRVASCRSLERNGRSRGFVKPIIRLRRIDSATSAPELCQPANYALPYSSRAVAARLEFAPTLYPHGAHWPVAGASPSPLRLSQAANLHRTSWACRPCR